MNQLTTAHAAYSLARFPEDPRDTLRAWDASDEYLLRQLDGTAALDGTTVPPVALTGTVVVLGDRWGALATALAGSGSSPGSGSGRGAASAPAEIVQISDSYLAQQATLANLERNGLAADAVTLRSTQEPPPARIDVLLVRVPKSLALLEDQLLRLAPGVHPGTVVVGTGMVTEIHTSTLKLFERILGPTRTSLAVRKARLILCTPDPQLTPGRSAWPVHYTLPADDASLGAAAGLTVSNEAGIFSAERLDIGTRFLLQHLPTRSGPETVVDLGCGNGVVGTAAALGNPDAEVVFTDESHQALASARATFAASGSPAKARFLLGDGLSDLPPGSADLVLNNPPFHSHQATTDAAARRMFADARTALRPGGQLWVVGNRHLNYHVTLRRLFGGCVTIGSGPKFVVLRATKR
ncbi:methyltransferase [Streptacidiphilus cavernicola]|uniref:Ribosomal RNA large subunit methyltransferase G n=1 Tax=Streptacidiphilus cavernicola TaxID=3342716 RepID=A0ABV6VSW7_9ACTN